MIQLTPSIEGIKNLNDLNRGTDPSMVTEEDKEPHETSAGVIYQKIDGKDCYLIMDHVKHNMLTFPIGKCKPNQSALEGLKAELKEEIGIDVLTAEEAVAYTKAYDFTGDIVPIYTHVFNIILADGVIENKEPDKCRGLMWLTEEEIMNSGRRIADCVVAYFNMKRMKKEVVGA